MCLVPLPALPGVAVATEPSAPLALVVGGGSMRGDFLPKPMGLASLKCLQK